MRHRKCERRVRGKLHRQRLTDVKARPHHLFLTQRHSVARERLRHYNCPGGETDSWRCPLTLFPESSAPSALLHSQELSWAGESCWCRWQAKMREQPSLCTYTAIVRPRGWARESASSPCCCSLWEGLLVQVGWAVAISLLRKLWTKVSRPLVGWVRGRLGVGRDGALSQSGEKWTKDSFYSIGPK